MAEAKQTGAPQTQDLPPRRAGVFSRICGHTLDLTLVVMLFSLVPQMDSIFLVLATYCYYLGCDLCFGRTPGKALCGLKYGYLDGKPVPKDRLLARAFL